MNMVPEKCPHSYPWSLTWCLFMWPKGFCRADLIRNLEMGRFFWLPRWAQRNHKDPYERDAWRVRVRQGDRTAEVQHRTVRSLVTRSSCRSCIGKERDSPEGIQPHWLSWYFWPREWWDNEFVGLEALVWSHLSQQELESSTPLWCGKANQDRVIRTLVLQLCGRVLHNLSVLRQSCKVAHVMKETED